MPAGVPGTPGYPSGGAGVDYLAAAGVAQYQPGAAVHQAAALASLAAAAAAGQHGTSAGTAAGLLDQAMIPPVVGHHGQCKC